VAFDLTFLFEIPTALFGSRAESVFVFAGDGEGAAGAKHDGDIGGESEGRGTSVSEPAERQAADAEATVGQEGSSWLGEDDARHDSTRARERAPRPLSAAAVRRATATLFGERASRSEVASSSRLSSSSPLLARAQRGVRDSGERFRRLAAHRRLRAIEAACILEGALRVKSACRRGVRSVYPPCFDRFGLAFAFLEARPYYAPRHTWTPRLPCLRGHSDRRRVRVRVTLNPKP